MAKKKYRPFSKVALKRWLYRKGRGRCHYCTVALTYEQSTIDHKKPRSKGGTYDKRNIVLACRICNAEKAANPYYIYKALWKQRLLDRKLREAA
jgi:5-methylcytosine-specific restriction endonuclease McrA